MEHEKEHHHAEAAKSIDEGLEQRYRRNQTPQQIEQVEDEIPHQKSRHQNRSDQCQQRRVFECHGRSMNVASVIRNSAASDCRLRAGATRRRRGLLASLKRRRATRGSIVSDC
jgi:hypothetical protein